MKDLKLALEIFLLILIGGPIVLLLFVALYQLVLVFLGWLSQQSEAFTTIAFVVFVALAFTIKWFPEFKQMCDDQEKNDFLENHNLKNK